MPDTATKHRPAVLRFRPPPTVPYLNRSPLRHRRPRKLDTCHPEACNVTRCAPSAGAASGNCGRPGSHICGGQPDVKVLPIITSGTRDSDALGLGAPLDRNAGCQARTLILIPCCAMGRRSRGSRAAPRSYEFCSIRSCHGTGPTSEACAGPRRAAPCSGARSSPSYS
jgi:hypothetical protein